MKQEPTYGSTEIMDESIDNWLPYAGRYYEQVAIEMIKANKNTFIISKITGLTRQHISNLRRTVWQLEEMAYNMMREGLPIDVIARGTGLSQDALDNQMSRLEVRKREEEEERNKDGN